MSIFNELDKAREAIQKSNVFDVKEVAEYELKKIYSVVKETMQREEQEFKDGKDKDYFFIIVGSGFGVGLLTGISFALLLF